MKISKNILRRLIKEELTKSINEVFTPEIDRAESIISDGMNRLVTALQQSGESSPEFVKSHLLQIVDGFISGYEMDWDEEQSDQIEQYSDTQSPNSYRARQQARRAK